jgi:hypothetical protein
MRSIFTTVAITAAGLLLFSGFAQASDVEAELRQMQERITDLESQLGSETDSFLPQEESGSAVSAMLENTDIGGFAAGSYNYNFEGFHNSNPDGTAYNNNPSHATSNTFQVDQVWVSIANAATEDSRGGFNVDYEWGAVNGAGASGELYAASVSYLAPVLGGVNLDLGLLPTMIGAEVNQTNGNLNVTRGIVWGIQPVTNLGAVASMQATDSISISFGVLNDIRRTTGGDLFDNDNQKAITGQVAWAGDDASASFSFNWGDSNADWSGLPGAGARSETGTYDFILNYGGMEDVSMWANYTLVSVDDGALEGDTHGIAAAARMALNESSGIAVRGEALIYDLDAGETEQYSLTFTGDNALTDNLTAKVELRFDFSSDDVLPNSNGTPAEDVATMVLAQLVYEF